MAGIAAGGLCLCGGLCCQAERLGQIFGRGCFLQLEVAEQEPFAVALDKGREGHVGNGVAAFDALRHAEFDVVGRSCAKRFEACFLRGGEGDVFGVSYAEVYRFALKEFAQRHLQRTVRHLVLRHPHGRRRHFYEACLCLDGAGGEQGHQEYGGDVVRM